MTSNNKFYSILAVLFILVSMSSCKTSSMMNYSDRNYDYLLNETNTAPARPVVKRDTVYETVVIKQQVVAQPAAQAPAVAPKATTQAPAATVVTTSPEVASTTVTTTTTTQANQQQPGYSFLMDWQTNVASTWKGFGSYRHYYNARKQTVLTNRFSIGGASLNAGAYWDKETGVTWTTNAKIWLESDFVKGGVEFYTSPHSVANQTAQSYGFGLFGGVFLRKTKKIHPTRSSMMAYQQHGVEQIQNNRRKLDFQIAFIMKGIYGTHNFNASDLVNIDSDNNSSVVITDDGKQKANHFKVYAGFEFAWVFAKTATKKVEHDWMITASVMGGLDNSKLNDAWTSQACGEFTLGVAYKF